MKISAYFFILTACLVVAACGANTGEPSAASANPVNGAASNRDANVVSVGQPSKSRSVGSAFKLAGGSGGSGELMKELLSNKGTLLDDNANYDVFDSKSPLGKKELKYEIIKSLDMGRVVLVDAEGTPESRTKAAEMVFDAVGASIHDVTGIMIRKAPEGKGDDYTITPIFSKADIQEQVARGLIPNAQAQTNSIDNIFFEPAKEPSSLR